MITFSLSTIKSYKDTALESLEGLQEKALKQISKLKEEDFKEDAKKAVGKFIDDSKDFISTNFDKAYTKTKGEALDDYTKIKEGLKSLATSAGEEFDSIVTTAKAEMKDNPTIGKAITALTDIKNTVVGEGKAIFHNLEDGYKYVIEHGTNLSNKAVQSDAMKALIETYDKLKTQVEKIQDPEVREKAINNINNFFSSAKDTINDFKHDPSGKLDDAAKAVMELKEVLISKVDKMHQDLESTAKLASQKIMENEKVVDAIEILSKVSGIVSEKGDSLIKEMNELKDKASTLSKQDLKDAKNDALDSLQSMKDKAIDTIKNIEIKDVKEEASDLFQSFVNKSSEILDKGLDFGKSTALPGITKGFNKALDAFGSLEQKIETQGEKLLDKLKDSVKGNHADVDNSIVKDLASDSYKMAAEKFDQKIGADIFKSMDAPAESKAIISAASSYAVNHLDHATELHIPEVHHDSGH